MILHMDTIVVNTDAVETAFGHRARARDLTYTLRTIDDFRRDRDWYSHLGRIVQDDGRVLRIEHAQINGREPVVNITVVDLGPIRGVLVEATKGLSTWLVLRTDVGA